MKAARGFTLIELLITITIATTLSTFGFSAYSKSHKIQLTKTATSQLSSIIDNTHKLALVGTRPDDCTGPFIGYQLEVTTSSNIVTTTPLCDTTNGISTTHTIENLTFDSSSSSIFRPLVAGVDLGGGLTTLNIDYLDNDLNLHRIILDQSGSHSYQGVIE